MSSSVTEETLVCANHPQTPTSLRCNKCGKLICTKCAVRTAVGYRCRDCLRVQQQVFETAMWYDYVVAVLLAAPLAGLAGLLVLRIGFFAILLAPVVGGVAAEVVRWGVRRRRGRYLPLTAAGGFVLGCLPFLFFPLLVFVMGLFGGEGRAITGGLFSLLWPLIYALLGSSTVYARLRGISV